MRTFYPLAAILPAAIIGMAAPAVSAAPADPAAARIDTLDQTLVATMKEGRALGPKGRFSKLAPVIESSFDLPVMTRYAVGPAWATMSPGDQQALVRAFARLTIASYAHNFSSYDGERFQIDKTDMRGTDKIVQSQLIPGHGAPVSLTYRMHNAGGAWKIIDVYYGAISQLTTRRSDFTGPLASGGAKGLLSHLDALADKLLS